MKIFDGMGPNPRFVRMFVIEKELSIPAESVDLMGGQNREEGHLARNPMGQLPCLETDAGAMISEITAIGEYLEEIEPMPALVGTTILERAETRMWTRRIDHNICEPLINGFRYGEGLGLFQDRMRTIPAAAEGLKALKHDNLVKLNGWMAGHEFICGDRFTMADLLLFAFLDFGAVAGQPIDPNLENIAAHFSRMGERPSAAASLEPVTDGASISA
jgi:glutathione S-transferase